MERTFKDRLAESLVPLVVALACAAAAWSAGPMTDPWHWGGLAATVAVAYAIHKVCSVNSVIPLRTWMTAAVLLLVLIAIIVLLILNPLQHRRKVSDPYAAKRAIKKIKKG